MFNWKMKAVWCSRDPALRLFFHVPCLKSALFQVKIVKKNGVLVLVWTNTIYVVYVVTHASILHEKHGIRLVLFFSIASTRFSIAQVLQAKFPTSREAAVDSTRRATDTTLAHKQTTDRAHPPVLLSRDQIYAQRGGLSHRNYIYIIRHVEGANATVKFTKNKVLT